MWSVPMDIVFTAVYGVGYKNKEQDACKKKFDRIWQTNKPTGTMEMPLCLKRAKETKDIILAKEIIG